MNAPVSPSASELASERRKRSNVRLAWAFVVFAVAVFAISILKYRPL